MTTNQTTHLIRRAIAGLALVLSAIASARADSPEVKLQATIASVMDVLYIDGQTIEQKRDQIQSILDSSFSFETMIQRALGRNRGKLSPAQLQTVTKLTTELLVRAYTKEFNNADRPKIDFEKTVELAANKIEIPTKVAIAGKQVSFTYRLAKLKEGWQVYDLLVEGISMVGNYNKQFDEHFQKKDADDLIQILKDKLAAL